MTAKFRLRRILYTLLAECFKKGKKGVNFGELWSERAVLMTAANAYTVEEIESEASHQEPEQNQAPHKLSERFEERVPFYHRPVLFEEYLVAVKSKNKIIVDLQF